MQSLPCSSCLQSCPKLPSVLPTQLEQPLEKPQSQSNQLCHWFRILQWLPTARTALHLPSSISCHMHLAHPLFSVIFPGVQTHLGVTWVRHIILILSVLICEMRAINKTFLRGLLLARACLQKDSGLGSCEQCSVVSSFASPCAGLSTTYSQVQ